MRYTPEEYQNALDFLKNNSLKLSEANIPSGVSFEWVFTDSDEEFQESVEKQVDLLQSLIDRETPRLIIDGKCPVCGKHVASRRVKLCSNVDCLQRLRSTNETKL